MDKVELVTVGIETKLGAHYSFPDMDRKELERLVIRDSDNNILLDSVMLTNVSRALITVPVRIIKKITIEGDDWWLAPS